jgi:hypothetical protein
MAAAGSLGVDSRRGSGRPAGPGTGGRLPRGSCWLSPAPGTRLRPSCQVVQGFMEHRAVAGADAGGCSARLAHLPLGSANDFARTLGWCVTAASLWRGSGGAARMARHGGGVPPFFAVPACRRQDSSPTAVRRLEAARWCPCTTAAVPSPTHPSLLTCPGPRSADPLAAAERIIRGQCKPLDVGLLTLQGTGPAPSGCGSSSQPSSSSRGSGYQGGCGGGGAQPTSSETKMAAGPAPRWFVNVASCGVGAAAVLLIPRYKRFWPLSEQPGGGPGGRGAD